jgi:transposase
VLHFLGVDISKAKLDVVLLLPNEKFKSKVFANDTQGFKSLLQWLQLTAPGGGLAEVHVCMEATGSYHEQLACFLHDQGAVLSVVNPLLVKRFAESNAVRNKTDGGDAKCLAMFCRDNKPARWEAPSPGVRALQALVARLDTLLAMRQAECNRLDVAQSVADSVRGVIANLDRPSCRSMHRSPAPSTTTRIQETGGPAQVHSGLGDKTIPQLVAYIGQPERFKSVKSLIAYASLTPLIRQSGTSLNKHRGTHPMGHHELKRALYFPAMVAGRYNPLVAAFWARLKAQNKPGKVIVVACMHKLLAIAYGVLRSGKPFDANHLKPAAA